MLLGEDESDKKTLALVNVYSLESSHMEIMQSGHCDIQFLKFMQYFNIFDYLYEPFVLLFPYL